jgi:GAF domain-containing protein
MMPILPWLERLLTTEPRREGLSALVVDAGVELTRADRGFLVLLDGPAARPRVAAARGYDRQTLESDDRLAWRAIVSGVLETGAGVITAVEPDASSAPRSRVVSVLCVPLRRRLGALYLDHPFLPDAFVRADLELLQHVADLASRALSAATD